MLFVIAGDSRVVQNPPCENRKLLSEMPFRVKVWSPAMREIVLDTETTGLDPTDGHRIVEKKRNEALP